VGRGDARGGREIGGGEFLSLLVDKVLFHRKCAERTASACDKVLISRFGGKVLSRGWTIKVLSRGRRIKVLSRG